MFDSHLCRSDAGHWRAGLRSTSRAGVHNWRIEAEAWQCRQLGNAYFMMGEGYGFAGGCLPASCRLASSADALAAARDLLGRNVEHVQPYTALPGTSARADAQVALVAAEGFGRPLPVHSISSSSSSSSSRSSNDTSSSSSSSSSGGAQRPKTKWFHLSLLDLIGEKIALPKPCQESSVLALALREFRGTMAEYSEAIRFIAEMIGRALSGKAMFLAAGATSMTQLLWGEVRVRWRDSRPFCGSHDWLRRETDAHIGIEVNMPPMWKLSARVVDTAFDRWPEAHVYDGILSLHVCPELSLAAHLYWTVPSDALGPAGILAARGSCARSVAAKLPELAFASVFVGGNSSIDWSNIEDKALYCLERLEAAFWEVRIDGESWPALANHRRLARELLVGADLHFDAFLCAPSRWEIDMKLITPEPNCDYWEVAFEVLPLLLAFQSGRYEELASIPPPPRTSRLRVSGGDRSMTVYKQQLVKYHNNAVLQRRSGRASSMAPNGAARAANAAAAAASGLSAAICITGRARTLVLPEVHRSLAENATGAALGAATSIFFVLDIGATPLSEFGEAFKHLPPTVLALEDGNAFGGPPTTCTAYMKCGPACRFQFQKLHNCLRLVETAEAARGRKFDWLIRLRPDMQILAPIGDLAYYDDNYVHLVTRPSFGDPVDHMALVPRRHANAVFALEAACPTQLQVALIGCVGHWEEGTAVTPECALRINLAEQRAPVAPFAAIYHLRREAVCRPDDPRGCGNIDERIRNR